MAEKKIMQFANFNITFGEVPNPKPMLSYFKEIIYPTFKSEYIRGEKGKAQFYFSDIKLKKLQGEYVLVGTLIKDTKYEVKTKIEGEKLVEAHSFVPTAPYSRFIIFLKNHRMVLLKNESASPDIRSFQKTFRTFVVKVLYNYNKGKKKVDRIPSPDVNIVDIPLPGSSIDDEISKFKKFNKLTLRLFPLNNDFDTSSMIRALRCTMNEVASKTAAIEMNSPSNPVGVKDVLENSNGTAIVTVTGIDHVGSEIKLKTNAFSSKAGIIHEGNITENDDVFIRNYAYSSANDIMNNVSLENQRLYDGFVENYSEDDYR